MEADSEFHDDNSDNGMEYDDDVHEASTSTTNSTNAHIVADNISDDSSADSDDNSSDSNDSDSSKSDSDDEEEDEQPVDKDELEKCVANYEREISSNPYLYEAHVGLIGSLKKLKNVEKLKAAREHMSLLFPLTEELWLDWIKEEKDDEKNLELLEKAVQDYSSAQIWLELSFHHMKQQNQPNYEEKVRKTFERAITQVGLHSTDGVLIWDAYREFEMIVMAGLQPVPGSMATVEQQEAAVKQTQRLAKLFLRQLSCPLIDTAKTMEEYKEWMDVEDQQVVKAYEKTSERLKNILPFEKKLIASNSLDNYNVYLEFALANFDPAHIQCIFERAIKDHCLEPQLWIKYTAYLVKHLNIGSVILGVYGRSVRNCPWCVELWTGFLRALEKHGAGHDKIRATFNDALLVGFTQAHEYLSIWTAYIDHLRRRIDWLSDTNQSELEDLREAFSNATNQLSQTFSKEGDPNCSLLQYQAFIEAKYCKNMPQARDLFTRLLQSGLANQATPWLQYAQLERSFGDVKHCRKVFQRALNSVTDWPEYVTDAYLKFEREEGDLVHYEEALEKCEEQMKRLEERKVKEEEKEKLTKGKTKQQKQKGKKTNIVTKASNQLPGTEADTAKKNGWQKNNNKNNNNKITGNRKAAAAVGENRAEVVKPYVRTRPKIFVRDAQEENAPVIDNEGFKVPLLPEATTAASQSASRPSRPVPPPPGFVPKSSGLKRPADDDGDVASAAKKSRIPQDSNQAETKPTTSQLPVATSTTAGVQAHCNESATVFVSNLDYSVEKEEIEKIFAEVGEVKEVRLVTKFNGKSKGYAYVEFIDEFPVASALKLDRKTIGDRPMYVSEYNKTGVKVAEPKLKFSVGLEKNKIFVKNLSKSTTKETLEDLFKQLGAVKDVRIVTCRKGSSKGLAYVDYENEASASQAIIKLDGSTVDGSVISVAISNPPTRKPALEDRVNSLFVPSLGGGKKESSRGNARTQLSMMPRSLARSNNKETPAQDTQECRPMSNDDFRSSFLRE